MADTHLNYCPVCGKRRDTLDRFCSKCQAAPGRVKAFLVTAVGQLQDQLLEHYRRPRTITGRGVPRVRGRR